MLSRKPTQSRNRRRERPGARTRHASSYRQAIRADIDKDPCVAHYRELDPFKPAKPSPLRQSLQQSWDNWKSREAEERAQAFLQRQQLEKEQCRLFGGHVDDDVSLLPGMLEVVRFLWGDIDFGYTDA
ncbi:MAG: hypothetical protein M1818_007203 [Claussenomyces sp. TS43310]|nr:MAG: hypothetical protein M1818_007203 [Claussenomyces sp. TS43310]